jgi:hypothetical protein
MELTSATAMDIVNLAVGIIALILGAIAVVLAKKHLHGIDEQMGKISSMSTQLDVQAANLDKQLNAQATRLEDAHHSLSSTQRALSATQRSLSTHFIGLFPKYLPKITELINRAENITIVCDFPGYGHYSDYEDWLDYRTAIDRQFNKGIPIKLMCFDKKRRSQCHKDQFFEAERAWKEWKQKQAERGKLQHFLQRHAPNINVDKLDQEDFAELLEETDQRMLEETFANIYTPIKIYPVPLYFWLIDGKIGKEAIFTIPSFSNKQLEYGFYTSDSNITSALAEMSKRYCRDTT